MSDEPTTPKKTVLHPAWRRLPQWFEELLEPEEEGKKKPQSDPRRVKPAPQQENKPL